MAAVIKSKTESSVTLEITVPLAQSMLQSEENITETLNEAGCLAAEVALKQFDTRGLSHTLWRGEMDQQGHLPQNLSDPLGRGECRAPRLSKLKRRSAILSPGAKCPNCPHLDPGVCQISFIKICRARLKPGVGRFRTKPPTHHRTLLSKKSLRCGGRSSTGERGNLGLCLARVARTGKERQRWPRRHLSAADRKRLARGHGGHNQSLR